MARTLTAAFQAETEAVLLRPGLLVKAEFDSGDTLMWTGNKDLSFGGDTYLGVGDFLGVGPVQETQQLVANGVQFVLTGIKSSLVSIALTEKYQWRPITMWFAVFDTSGALIADPYKTFSGKMDIMEITDNGTTSTITLNAENNLIDLKDSKERRYTPEDQKAAFAGDLGLDFVPLIQDVQINWGMT